MANILITFVKYPSNIFAMLLLVLVIISISCDTIYSVTTAATTTRFPLYHREKFIANRFNDHRSVVLARLNRDMARFKQLQRRLNRHKNVRKLMQLNEGIHNHTGLFEEGGEYVTVLEVGTPPQKVQLLVDLGTPFTWWQCQPNCEICSSTPHHVFDTSMSSTYTEISCSEEALCDVNQHFILGCLRRGEDKCHYRVEYFDRSVTQGIMANDTVTVENFPILDSFSFGCGRRNEGMEMFNPDATGILGFVPGGYSFPTQYGATSFTLCLPPYNTTSTGSLHMNEFDPILESSSKAYLNIMDHFYLDFSGIEINEEAIPIPPEFWEPKEKGVGGFIIDTGSTITRFPKKAYDIFKYYFVRQAKGLPLAPGEEQLDTCFHVAGVTEWTNLLPKVKFLFKAKVGPPLDFQSEQLMMSVGNGKYCLAFGAGGPTSVFGSWQLQDSLVGFDFNRNIVGFRPGYCTGSNN